MRSFVANTRSYLAQALSCGASRAVAALANLTEICAERLGTPFIAMDPILASTQHIQFKRQ